MSLYNGWLVIDKPVGLSSNEVVQKVRKSLGKKNKVGHAGTLDPLAHGVLPVALGEATKTVQYLMDASKIYEFTVTWGEERDTGDAAGKIISEGGGVPQESEIKAVLPKFIGKIMQMPPIYSALKINGQRAYKLAREGKQVELKPREVRIDSFVLVSHQDNTSSFRVACGKGTYVRSLAVDIARELNTYGYVSYLKRSKVGGFFIDDAIMLANLDKLVHNGEIQEHLLPVTYGLGDILAIEVDAEQTKALRNGLKIFLSEHAEVSVPVAQILCDGVLQAVVCIEKGLCKSLRVFNL
jgi:tRNA pseudouridine55 synthase